MQYWDPDIRQLAESADHSRPQPIMWPPNHSPSITLVWCFNYTISFNHSIYSITFNGDIDPNITHYNPLYNHWFIFKNPIDGNPCGTLRHPPMTWRCARDPSRCTTQSQGLAMRWNCPRQRHRLPSALVTMDHRLMEWMQNYIHTYTYIYTVYIYTLLSHYISIWCICRTSQVKMMKITDLRIPTCLSTAHPTWAISLQLKSGRRIRATFPQRLSLGNCKTILKKVGTLQSVHRTRRLHSELSLFL
jgi:hypothetical protein